MKRWAAAAALIAISAAQAVAADPLRLHAAGSLRAVMGEIGAAYSAAGGAPVTAAYGASGLLRERLDKGEASDLFASANMEHPRMLAASGKAQPVVLFARNRLCALARKEAGVTSAGLLDKMLDPSVKLGTSTPKADPSGDYAWELFARAEKLKPGAKAALEAKALKLTGGPDSPPPPKDRNVYGVLVGEGKADIFLTYCTNARLALKEQPSLVEIEIPENLAVGADYGLTVMANARPEAQRLALFILSQEGQAILKRHGFDAPLLPVF